MPYMYAAAGNLDDTTISPLQAVMWILTAVGLACHLLFEVRRQDSASHPARGHGRDGAGGLGGHGVLRHAAGSGQWPIAGLASGVRGAVGHLGRFSRPVLLRAVVNGAVPDAACGGRAGHHVLPGTRCAGRLVARGRGCLWCGNPRLRDRRHHHVRLSAGVACGGRHLVPNTQAAPSTRSPRSATGNTSTSHSGSALLPVFAF